MSYILKEYFAGMEPERYELIVGRTKTDPLTRAFAKKRVVHPGLPGRPVCPQQRQAAWEKAAALIPTPDTKRTAYLHIPFCSKMCLYCGFFQNYSNEDKESRYIDHLIAELAMDAEKNFLNGGLIQAVFVGGGTPSALSPANAERLLRAVRQCLPLSNDVEITWEARVNDLREEKMDAWFAGGVNRVSVGVQSFDTDVRRAVGRIDDHQTVFERIEKLASYGQAAVIIDLIYGLPGQDLPILLSDLAAADALPIDGMDLYQLNVFEVSPLKKAIEAGKLPPPATTAQQAVLFDQAGRWLGERAYRRVSGCHWAKGIRERSLYNTLTKSGAQVVPFGAGAGGNVGGYSLFLQRDMEKYCQAVQSGVKPLLVIAQKSAGQDLHNTLIGQLEQGYLDLRFMAEQYGEAVDELDYLLKIWAENGLMVNGPVLSRLTEAGRFWQANIAQSLLECLQVILEGTTETQVERIAGQG